MYLKKVSYFVIAIACGYNPVKAFNRSLLRPQEKIPQITTHWEDKTTTYILRDSHLEQGPIFKVFDENFFFQHMLPDDSIQYRNQPTKCVDGAVLKDLIENLLVELKQKKKRFTDFVLLKSADFNFADFCGLMVLKFKNYPFVLKLFIENPKSFVKPYNKGLEPMVFFVMGGGIMRHLTGFTRIQNLEVINKQLKSDPYWSQIIDTPRKWHWLPKDSRWFVVEGKNIGPSGDILTTTLPSVYGIIADEIVVDKRKTLLNYRHALRCMRLCQFTDYRIDPHIQNFHIERGTGKLVLIDTENFRILVGLRERFSVDSYIAWYLKLGKKFLGDKFFRDKQARLNLQIHAADWDILVA